MSARYQNRKTQVLNEVYRKEGDCLLEENKYEEAITKYNQALQLYPRDLKSLVCRSKCFMHTKNIRKSLDDTETALHLNNLYKEALLQKGDILYLTQDYDLALIYYNRGHKVYPRNKGFIDGMKKTEHEINKFRKGKGKKQKLTPAGDLTYLIHKVPEVKPFKFQTKQDRQVKHLPSATFNTRPLCQLIRIHKTPTVSLMRSVSVPDLGEHSDDDDLQDKRPESRLVKSTIGEFYDDKKYLEKLASGNSPRPDKPKSKKKPDKIEEENEEEKEKNTRDDEGKAENETSTQDGKTSKSVKEKETKTKPDTKQTKNETPSVSQTEHEGLLFGLPLESIANDALHFLFDRVAYWDRLGPLPPPPPPRKSKSNKMSASTMSLDSFMTLNSTNTTATNQHKKHTSYNLRHANAPVKIDPSKLNFKFKSLVGMDERQMSRILEDDELSEYPSSSPDYEKYTEKAGQSVTDYIKKEIEKIKEGYKLGWMQETYNSCDSCLRLLEKYSEEEVPEKQEMTGILHSYQGNCAVQNRRFDEALKHHKIDLSIGEEHDIKSVRNRALGNIGRVYMLQGKHQKALESLTMKAPLCKNAKESAALFHEIGNCFLLLSHFRYAKDAAKKSLQCAEECGDKQLQLQACVLNGLADVNLKKYKDAHKCFEEALTHAQGLGDKRAEEAMEQALIDVNKKIAHKIKSKTLQNRADTVNQQPLVGAV